MLVELYCPTAAGVSLASNSHETTRRVSFHDDLEVIEFPYIVGDNPGCSAGVPLSMDWTPQLRHFVSLDEYESVRQPIRRHSTTLAISAQERRDRLLKCGYTSMEINQASRKRHIARQQRKQTQELMELDTTLLMFQKIAWTLPKKGIQKVWRSRRDNKPRMMDGKKASMHGTKTEIQVSVVQ
jgi:hypothetical protein